MSRAKEGSLDLLEHEDHRLLALFATLTASRSVSVQQRFAYGNAAKQIIRHLGIRQACLMDVGMAIASDDDLAPLGRRMVERAVERREQFDVVGDMSRSMQGMYLNQGQDFDAEMKLLVEAVKIEIEWELCECVPAIRDAARAHSARVQASPVRSSSGESWVSEVGRVGRPWRRSVRLLAHACTRPPSCWVWRPLGSLSAGAVAETVHRHRYAISR